MNPIEPPLRPGDLGPDVVNLHDGLRRLLDARRIDPAGNPAELLQALAEETAEQRYGTATTDAVRLLQEQHNVEATGEVDDLTARIFNRVLTDLGGFSGDGGAGHEVVAAIHEQSELLRSISEGTSRLQGIEARIPDTSALEAIRQGTDQLPLISAGLAGLDGATSVLAEGSRGSPVHDLHQQLTHAGFLLPREEMENSVFGVGTRDALIRLQEQRDLIPTGTLDAGTRSALAVAVDISRNGNRLEGRVLLDNGLPAVGLHLRAVNRGFGGSENEIGTFETDAQGFYALSYQPDAAVNNLEIHAAGPGESTVKLSEAKAHIGRREVLNLVAPAAVVSPEAEYRRLSSDLARHIGEMTALGTAQEDGSRDDLATLHRETGWDARALAMAASAAQLRTRVGGAELSQEGLYGLLRAGLPSDELLLAQTDPDVVSTALKTARDAGIVALTDDEIGTFTGAFPDFATRTLLSRPAPGAPSTYGDLLSASGLEPEAREAFASAYLHADGTGEQLWADARAAGLDEPGIARLQLHGKFAFLSGNSAPVTKQLMEQGVTDPVELVDLDLYEPERWKDKARLIAGGDDEQLAALIPAAYAGGGVEERLGLYAEDTARKVRRSYPTQVLGRRLERDAEDAFGLGELRTDTATVLKSAARQGFRLGQTPADAFFDSHPGVTVGIGDGKLAAVRTEVKKLHRVYQMTPNDESIPILLKLGLDSAHDVVGVSEDTFVDLYGRYFSTPAEARLIHRKAVQISEATYSLFGVAAASGATPAMRGVSGAPEIRDQVRNDLVKQFPTMESLFGSLDYCECEHCSSVLGPAAYLVDLLQYVDIEPAIWEGFLNRWELDHGGSSYGPTRLKPYDALMERRPDLAHLELTCENTTTELPYIDIVNQVLEYFLAHGALAADAAHDVDGASSEDLLAEPQHVLRAAYEPLRAARYPLTLPFDLWLETVRQFCASFDIPLARVLEVFRTTDELFAPTAPYDSATIFLESLGLSPAQVAILTDPAPLTDDAWYDLYGLTRTRAAVTAAGGPPSTVDVADADTAQFFAGDVCTYVDTSAGTRHPSSNVIAGVGAAGSGGAAGQTRITFTDIWDAAPEATDLLVLDAPAALRSAKYLARRLEVTYKELVTVVQTGFVNPELPALGILRTLGVSVQGARFYDEHVTFFEQNNDLIGADRAGLDDVGKARYDALGVRNVTTGRTGWEDLHDLQSFEEGLAKVATERSLDVADLRARVRAVPFDRVLVLADPDAGCDFSRTLLQHADGSPAEPITYLRINLFLRLWRSLGWTMAELDVALRTFLPSSAAFEPAHLADRPLLTALIGLTHLKSLSERLNRKAGGKLPLLTLWGNLPTDGPGSSYAQLFLAPAMLRLDPVFDSAVGAYLSPQEVGEAAAARTHRVERRGVAPTDKLDAAALAANPKVQVTYDELEQVQHLSYAGVLDDAAKQALLASLPAPSPVLSALLDAVQVQASDYTRIRGHLTALQGALGLTSDEIGLILSAPRAPLETAELSLPHVSLLHRYAVLARGLGLSVRDVLRLQELSGIDPFPALHPDPLTSLAQDAPFTSTLRFVECADDVRASGLKLEDLDYLLRHRFDAVGTYRSDTEEGTARLTALAEGIRAIRAAHAVPADPGDLTDEVLRQKLGLVLPTDVGELFLALLGGTAPFTAARPGIAAAARLGASAFAGEPSISEVTYDAVTQTQRMTVRGLLFDEGKAALTARMSGMLTTEQRATLGALLDDVQAEGRRQTDAFFLGHLQKQQLTTETTTGFLDPADFALLLNPDLPLAAGETPDSRRRTRLRRLAESFLPFLQRRLIGALVLDTMTTQHADAEPALVASLLTDERLLHLPASGAARALADVLVDAAGPGVTATFFASPDASGGPLGDPRILPDADLSLPDAAGQLPPAGANSARLEGYLQVPAAGAYRFFVPTDKAGATAELRFAHLPAPTLTGAAAADAEVLGAATAQYAELKPGVPYRHSLLLTSLGGGTARLLVQSVALPKDRLGQLTLHPAGTLDAAARADLLLTKALQLFGTLGLTERESRHLLLHPGDFGSLDLSQLPTRPGEETAAGTTALFGSFRRLAHYAVLRRELAGGTDELVDVFEADGAGSTDVVFDLLARLTRRDRATVEATARALFPTPAFGDEESLQRLWDALQVVEQFGVPVRAVRDWTRIVRAGAAPDERFGVARDLKEVLRARFDTEAWRRVAQPVFDRLRARQRDALARYVMHQRGFTSMEQLYEYFLLDPGMEPVVRTSPIRCATGSVQAFVQRCLLNLERKVPPSAIINARYWDWMKRYPVWAGFRKMWLYPENYLEPEFRDDKTSLCVELESSLLQGDVSAALVDKAFTTYLEKLDGLARLDVMATHLEEKDDPAANVLHVVARTYGVPHEYHYRRYAAGNWTAWEPVTAEIEGDHLAPVVWRDRLYLFWVTFARKASPADEKATKVDFKTPIDVKGGPPTILEAALHWSTYVDGAWTKPESSTSGEQDGQKLTATGTVESLSSLLVHVAKEPAPNGEGGVFIGLGKPFNSAFYLASRNSTPEKSGAGGSAPVNAFSAKEIASNRWKGAGAFVVTYDERISAEPGKRPQQVSPPVLGSGGSYTLVTVNNDLASPAGDIGNLVRPVFYADNRNTFFVEPALTERTVQEWQEWVTPPRRPERRQKHPDWWDTIEIQPLSPRPPYVEVPIPVDPWRFELSHEAVFAVDPAEDWLTGPATRVVYGDSLIDASGRVDVELNGTATGNATFDAVDTTALNVVGAAGIDAAMHQNLSAGRAGMAARTGNR